MSENGVVKWFNVKKGYGFLLTEAGDEVFVHHSEVARMGGTGLIDQEMIQFDVGEGPDGRKAAKNLVRI
jgi:CspA family cold shock protein